MATLIKDFDKTVEMGRRIYNSKTIEKKDVDGKVIYRDEDAIKALCSQVFSGDGEISSIEDLRSFNKLIVETANIEAQAQFEQIVNAVSDFQTVGRNDQMVYYKVPTRVQTTMHLAASTSGVDFTKIPARQTKVPAIPQLFQMGVKYSISDMINDPINAFKSAVNLVVAEKVRFVFQQIMALARNGQSSGKIPAGQCFDSANMTLSAFRKIEDKLLRAGRNARPVLIADNNFIGTLALKQGTEGLSSTTNLAWLTDEMRNSLLRDVSFDMVSRSFAIATDNPFIDEAHSKVDLNVNEALILAGGEGAPFKITEYGALRNANELPSIEKEEVHFKIDYKINISLLLGNQIGYIRDTAITL